MSRIDPIAKAGVAGDAFAVSFDRLVAVDSVVALVADMAQIVKPVTVNLSDRAHLQSIYEAGSSMLQKQFDRDCIDLAVIARAGVQALLQLKSEGRQNIDVAASCLMREIQINGRQISMLL